jgi:hypothetical protein
MLIYINFLFIYLFKISTQINSGSLFANYDTNNKSTNYSERLHVPVQNLPGIS